MTRPRRGQRGFVLVATLWVLAAITIGAAYFAEQVDRSRELAQQAQGAAQALVEMESTRAEILFRLATSGFSVYGLGEKPESAIRLDDRPYRGTGADIVRLQDNRGLLNLNFLERGLLPRLLGEFGVPVQRQDLLMDTLLDYVDTDGLRRLNGAEAREYETAGLPPPANDWLTTPYELRNIIGWRDETSLWRDQRFMQVVTTTRVNGFDPNTAPLEVLASLPGSNLEIARRIIAQRRVLPLVSESQMVDLAGGNPVGGVDMVFFPSNSVRISQQGKGLPWMLQYSVALTPASSSAPWRVDYHVRTSAPRPIPDERETPALPAWSASQAEML